MSVVSTPTPEQMSYSPVYTSKSKQLYSFPKAQRFNGLPLRSLYCFPFFLHNPPEGIQSSMICPQPSPNAQPLSDMGTESPLRSVTTAHPRVNTSHLQFSTKPQRRAKCSPSELAGMPTRKCLSEPHNPLIRPYPVLVPTRFERLPAKMPINTPCVPRPLPWASLHGG